MVRRFIQVVSLACLLASAGWAQSFLSGRVIDASGAAVPDARVTVLKDGQQVATALTNGAGVFTLALDPGEYRVKVEAAGFLPVIHPADVRLRRRTDLSAIPLSPTTVHEHIEVHGMAPEVDPGQVSSVRSVTHEAIQALPDWRTETVQSLALTLMPGAVLSHDNFTHVRGNEMSLHEAINGVCFLDNTHQHFAPGLNPQIFEAASFISGGFSPEFGNRFGGVVDISTRGGASLGGHGSVSLSGGSLPNGEVAADYGGTYKKLGYYAFVNGVTTDRFLNTPEFHTLHDHGATAQGALQLDYTAGKNLFKLLIFGGGDNFELPNTFADQLEGRDATRRLRAQSVIGTWQRTINDHALWTTSVYQRTIGDRVLPTPDPVTEFALASRSTLTVGAKSDFSYIYKSHLVKAGIDVTHLRLLESVDSDPRDPADDLPAFAFQGGKHGQLAAFYLQDHFSPVRDLTLDLGLRFDRFDLVHAYNMGSPRAAVAYHIRKTHSVLHFSYNRLFSPPPLEYSLLANFLGNNHPEADQRPGDQKPYLQSYYEVGWSQQITPDTTLELNAYKHRGENSFENTELHGSRIFAASNFARAHAQGIEFSLVMKQLERIGLGARLNYAATQTYFFGPFSGGFQDEGPLTPGERTLPAFDERHMGSILLTYRHSQWRNLFATTNLMYGSGTALEGGIARVPAHCVADLGAGFDVWKQESKRLTLELSLENVADHRYQISKESEETPIQYAQGRVVSGRFKFRF